jgi:RimJ/RimL family protein N-acetyltransferase
MSLQHECTPRPRGPMPAAIPDENETLGRRHDIRPGETIVLARALTESEWERVRAFVRRTSRESLRLRFGQAADFLDDHTLKRFFHIEDGRGEMIWMLEQGGAVCAIAHLVRLSAAEAEIALIVRSDCTRRGIGEKLLRVTLAHAARQGLATLSALVLHENTAMLRLARKVGFEPRKSCGVAVELEFDLGQICDTGTAAAFASAPVDAIEAAVR